MRIRKSKSVRLAAVLAASSLVLAACGDDDDDAAADDRRPRRPPTAPAPAAGGHHRARRRARRRATRSGCGSTAATRPTSSSTTRSASSTRSIPTSRSSSSARSGPGIVEKLTTSLSSSDSPDVVEFGNTQAQAFEAAGAVADLTPHQAELGGDDLLQSLLEAGTYDGKLYAVPYYAGARIMIYRKDLFEAAGVEIPTTLDEMVAAGVALQEANADVPNFSGIYLPGTQLVRGALVPVGQRRRHRHPGERRVGRPARLARLDRRSRVLQDAVRHGQRRTRRR